MHLHVLLPLLVLERVLGALVCEPALHFVQACDLLRRDAGGIGGGVISRLATGDSRSAIDPMLEERLAAG